MIPGGPTSSHFKRRCIWLLGRPTEAAKKANENAF